MQKAKNTRQSYHSKYREAPHTQFPVLSNVECVISKEYQYAQNWIRVKIRGRLVVETIHPRAPLCGKNFTSHSGDRSENPTSCTPECCTATACTTSVQRSAGSRAPRRKGQHSRGAHRATDQHTENIRSW